jgi:hypothetical protein
MNMIRDTKLMLPVELFAGSDIGDVAKEMCRVATLTGMIAKASFNGVELYAKPNADPADLVRGYHDQRGSLSPCPMAWAHTKPKPSVEMHYEGEPMMREWWSLKIADLHATVKRIRDLVEAPSALDNNSKLLLIGKHAALTLKNWESK